MPITPTSRLVIRHLKTNCLLPADCPGPERIRDRFDCVMTRSLPTLVAQMLRVAFAESDPGLWFIRRLAFDVDVDAGADDDVLGKSFAAQFAGQLVRTCAGGANDRDVIRFPDRAAYLARFLTDRAAGTANRWYYNSFAGLTALPVSTALCTAICDHPEVGHAALMALAPAALRAVVSNLSSHDARRVLSAISNGDSAGNLPTCLNAAWSAWTNMPLPQGVNDAQNALLVYLSAHDVAGPNLVKTALAIVRFARHLAAIGPDNATRLIEALSTGDSSSLYALVGAADAETLAPLRAASPPWLRNVTDTLLDRSSSQAVNGRVPRHTQFGGAFLLLPMLEEMPLADASANWPGLGKTPAAHLVRLLLLCKCFGNSRAHEAFVDPLLREFSGVRPEADGASLSTWQTGIVDEHVERLQRVLEDWHVNRGAVSNVATLKAENDFVFLSAPVQWGLSERVDRPLSIAARGLLRWFAWRLPGFGRSSLAYLHENFLDFRATVEDEPGRRVVRLGRPPLDLILRMTGINRGAYTITRIDDRPFALFPEP